ncbi:MAG: hypothetical protein JWM35_2518, partial [Verrucomicrobia bacterium]|nr:hypothetical protein [Verrucomicrobiota bacterium]
MSAAFGASPSPTVTQAVPTRTAEPTDVAVSVEANPAALLENGANVWPDESAESLFLSGQKEQEAPAVATSAV